ncbi:MAG: ester cyclase [Chloroflexota bacterium]|nr:ester cyclase [Chloroflexota bacterium]
MSQQNKAIERRLLEEVYDQGKLDVIDELIASDFIGHGTAAEGGDQGREAYRQFVVQMRTAFPDLKMTVEDQVAEGDKVVTRFRARGTHLGEFQGLPPSGKQGEISGTIIDRIAGGKIVECWSNTDDLGLLQQLGVVPVPERATAD